VNSHASRHMYCRVLFPPILLLIVTAAGCRARRWLTYSHITACIWRLTLIIIACFNVCNGDIGTDVPALSHGKSHSHSRGCPRYISNPPVPSVR
jgi:hypothetical protein